MISLLRRETCIRIGLLKHPQAMEGFWGVTGLSKKIVSAPLGRQHDAQIGPQDKRPKSIF